MKAILSFAGVALTVAAAYFLYLGVTMDTAVPNTGSEGAFGNVVNLQLMHFQLIYVMIGMVAGLGAVVLFAGAAIVVAIEDSRPQ